MQPFPAHSHYSRQQLKGLCELKEHIFQSNTHSVTVLCQKLGILVAELAEEMMPVPGHAFTTRLLRGNPLSSALSWAPNHGGEQLKCFLLLCLLRGSDSQGKEGWKCQPEQGFQKLRANPCSYKHMQFHFTLLENNRFSPLFKQTPVVFAQHIRNELSPKASHFQPAGFKLCSSLTPSSQWIRSSCSQRPRQDDVSTHKTGKKNIQHIFWVTYTSTLANVWMNWMSNRVKLPPNSSIQSWSDLNSLQKKVLEKDSSSYIFLKKRPVKAESI